MCINNMLHVLMKTKIGIGHKQQQTPGRAMGTIEAVLETMIFVYSTANKMHWYTPLRKIVTYSSQKLPFFIVFRWVYFLFYPDLSLHY